MKAYISSAALLALFSSPPLLSVAGVSAFQVGEKVVNSRPALVGSASTSSSSSAGKYAPSTSSSSAAGRCVLSSSSTRLQESSTDGEDAMAEADAALKSMPVEEQKEKIGNLVADDEWLGLGMEIS